MSPEEVKEVLHRQVYSAALEIASNRPIHPNHHDVHVQSICAAIFGSQWYRGSHDEQRAKKKIVQVEYRRLLARYLPVLQKFQRDTNEILEPSEAFLANVLGKADAAFDKPTGEEIPKPIGEEILKGLMVESRDQAARKRLGPRYWTYEQYRTDLVKRREAALDAQHEPFDFRGIPLNEDQKTKKCPICEKNIHVGSASRHVRQIHTLDPRNAIFCPRCPLKGPVYVVWRGDSSIDTHLLLTHKTVLNKKKGKAVQDKNKEEAMDKVNQIALPEDDEPGFGYAEQAEQAEYVQRDDQFEVMDEEVLEEEAFNEEMLDQEVLDEEVLYEMVLDKELDEELFGEISDEETSGWDF